MFGSRVPVHAALHAPETLDELGGVRFRDVEGRNQQLEGKTRRELRGQIGLTPPGEGAHRRLRQALGLVVHGLGPGYQHGQCLTQVATVVGNAVEPTLGPCFEVGIVGKDRRDVVVAGDPEAVAQPVAIAGIVLAQDLEQWIRIPRELGRQELDGLDLLRGLSHPLALINLVGAKARGAVHAFRNGDTVRADDSQSRFTHGRRFLHHFK